ncbi:CASP-like protein 4B1 [Mangifera indica]|uniref:CASP-like protein 4B1 n=1 Tax=Mangifera indica TaxID=29780 RepID=UPI001CFB110F|nr:CASP-like protein 4B1 [Mangifera indica]
MSNSDDKNQAASLPVGAPPMDVEGQTPASGVSAITRRSRRDDLLKRGSLALRGVALFFSLIAFIVMVSNKHGDGKDFDEYEEFRYVLAIAILSTLYTGGQTLRHSYEMSTGKQLLQPRTSALFDFSGDQTVAYLLISAASAAIPMTNRMREGGDNIFTDSLAASISMEILAFIALALSALISGYRLTTQSQI